MHRRGELPEDPQNVLLLPLDDRSVLEVRPAQQSGGGAERGAGVADDRDVALPL